MSFTPTVACRLRDALRDEISGEIADALYEIGEHPFGDVWLGSRYLPRTNRERLDRLHVSFYFAHTNPRYFDSGVEGDEDDHTIEISFSQAVPGVPTNAQGMPDIQAVDNTLFGDQMMAVVERVKQLWRPEDEDGEVGRLRHKSLVGCQFTRLVHDPVIEPEPLIKFGVLAIVLAAIYRQGH